MANTAPCVAAVVVALVVFSAGPGMPVVPDVQAARDAPLLGFNDHPLDGRAPADAATMLDQVRQLGAGLVRIDVHWGWFEWARPGRSNWNTDQVRQLDAYLNAATDRGIAVQLVVLGTPCWAASGPPRDCTLPQVREAAEKWAPRNAEEFAAFVQEIVHFSAGRVRYIGIGNEPNDPAFWAPPDPAAYTRLLLATYPVIKSADPGIAVVGGALAPGSPFGAELDTLAYLQAMYAAGAGGAFDYLEYHPYTDGNSPDWFDSGSPLLSFTYSVPAVRAAMLANGDDRPMILGEIGWTTGQNSPGASVSRQADYLGSALRIAQGWPFVHSVIIYELVDHGPADSADPIDHFGVLDRQLRAKPAVGAIEAVGTR